MAAHGHQAAGHAGANAVAGVAVDDQFASGHAGAEAVHVRHRTQDAHTGGTLAADVEEIAERALSRAGPRRKRGEQAILFLNRRGFSPSVRCGSCGKIVRCPHCSVSLTFHKRAGARMRCHYCEYDTSLAQRCAYCNAPSLVLEGLGTRVIVRHRDVER
jgi:primosomal protein N' (replication factor Y)